MISLIKVFDQWIISLKDFVKKYIRVRSMHSLIPFWINDVPSQGHYKKDAHTFLGNIEQRFYCLNCVICNELGSCGRLPVNYTLILPVTDQVHQMMQLNSSDILIGYWINVMTSSHLWLVDECLDLQSCIETLSVFVKC